MSDVDKYRYYLVTSVVKVDIEKEGWDGIGDMEFGLANMTTNPKSDGVSDPEDEGVHMVGYSEVDEPYFREIKNTMFTEEGGI